MNKIINYKLVTHNEVHSYIADFWQPYGQPLAIGGTVYQAIVLYEGQKEIDIYKDAIITKENELKIAEILALENEKDKKTAIAKFYDEKIYQDGSKYTSHMIADIFSIGYTELQKIVEYYGIIFK